MRHSKVHLFLPILATGAGAGIGCDAAPNLQTVRGQLETIYVTEDAQMTVPVDLRGIDMLVLSKTTSGEFREHLGAGSEDGRFEVPDVPEGLYYFRHHQAAAHFFVQEGKDLYVGELRLGRPDVLRTADAATQLEVSVDGLSPWTVNDNLFLSCAGCGGSVNLLTGAPSSERPDEGDENASFVVAYDRFDSPQRLAESSKGDRVFLVQRRQGMENLYRYWTAVRWTELPGLDQAAGRRSVIQAELSTSPRVVEGTFPRSTYNDLRQLVGPEGKTALSSTGLSIVAVPQSDQLGIEWAAWFQPLVIGFNTGLTVVPFTIEMSSPFPESWMWVTYGAEYGVRVFEMLGFSTLIRSYVPLELFDPAVLSKPSVLPVQDLRINGHCGFDELEGVGESVELTWMPRATGAVDLYYVIQVFRLEDLDFTNVVSFVTREASVVVPPGFVSGGSRHFVTVTALQLTDGGRPGGFASVISATFIP